MDGVIGKGLIRKDVKDKLCGRTRYTDDLHIPNAWHGYVVRSPVSHGKLRGLRLDPAFDWSQVVVVTPEDIPGPNVYVMHDRSMPVLADDEILYLGEPLALVAAENELLARTAADHIAADIEELSSILTLDEVVEQFKATSPDLVKHCEQTIVKGSVEDGFAAADHVLEDEYKTGFQEQLYIEPQAMVATPEEGGGVFIQGSLQCPYYIVHEAHEALGLRQEKVRVQQAAVGGAFGGKEEFPSLLASYCALLALKSGKPVKIIYDRNQDIRFTTKRHPSWVRIRAGLKNDGAITAIQVDYLLDGGAYLTISDVVMYRGILHAAMGYRCDHVFVNGLVGRTNTFPCGAFRGFGAPQATWALESHIDRMAAACGIDPHEFRLKNCLRKGDITPTGQVLESSVGSPAVIEDALERAQFSKKLERCSHGRAGDPKWYGIGVSFFAHGAGFTGDGEARIGTIVALELDRDEERRPIVTIRVSSTEMGQGSLTALSQIVADGLEIDVSHVSYPLPDTRYVPNSGPTVASRTTMVVGSTLFGAAAKMNKVLEEFGGEGSLVGFVDVANRYLDAHGPLRVEHGFSLPPTIKWDQQSFEGDAYPAYSWGCNIAEVEVDTLTLEVKLVKVTACYDIGRVINPVLAKGQLEGGLTQAFGYALMEKMGIKDGVYDADRMQTYVIPTMLDIPEFDISFVEFPYEFAAPGAKGVGEIPMNGLAPAIGNAIEQATGLRLNEIPITPEDLFKAMQERDESRTST